VNDKITIQDLIDLKNEDNEILNYLNKHSCNCGISVEYMEMHTHYLCKER
jgi:hypothetical protein